MKKILFVCTGNICRSPMAEGLFRDTVKNRDDISISSAGLAAIDGHPPSMEGVAVLQDVGIDISSLRSQMITTEEVDQADLIFVMTTSHLMAMMQAFPAATEKTFLLREFEDPESGQVLEVADPIGMGMDAYLRTRDMIKKSIPGLLAFIDQTD